MTYATAFYLILPFAIGYELWFLYSVTARMLSEDKDERSFLSRLPLMNLQFSIALAFLPMLLQAALFLSFEAQENLVINGNAGVIFQYYTMPSLLLYMLTNSGRMGRLFQPKSEAPC
ncbi:hypothetical protein [Algicella marina]|uniref:Uncharacterized protein n=1 Tax=Algicella marina TaxID=2683284 RepID=A0A6P1T830_9RHOB|nr:hypothetical protein [Algicella marina]QHQ36752.1 hypothetical protein GO499_17005 [Algicella marina]